jgi:hypothetical protein
MISAGFVPLDKVSTLLGSFRCTKVPPFPYTFWHMLAGHKIRVRLSNLHGQQPRGVLNTEKDRLRISCFIVEQMRLSCYLSRYLITDRTVFFPTCSSTTECPQNPQNVGVGDTPSELLPSLPSWESESLSRVSLLPTGVETRTQGAQKQGRGAELVGQKDKERKGLRGRALRLF